MRLLLFLTSRFFQLILKSLLIHVKDLGYGFKF